MDKDTLEFLKELQEELNKQEIDNQASPRFWVIYDYKEEPTDSDFSEGIVFYIPEYDDSYKIDELYELILEVNEDRGYCIDEVDLEEIKFELEEENIPFIEEWVQEYITEEVKVVYVKEVGFIVPNTLFITKKEAVNHLQNNRHRYTSKAHTYAMTALRSPVVSKLWNILEQTDWK